jgi:hypothetical protein
MRSATSACWRRSPADQRATLLLVRLGGEHPETTVPEVIDVVEEADADPGFTAGISGPATVGNDFLTISERTCARASCTSAARRR